MNCQNCAWANPKTCRICKSEEKENQIKCLTQTQTYSVHSVDKKYYAS